MRAAAELFIRGDTDGDGTRETIADVITVLDYLFVGERLISCLDAADANDDGGVNIADATAAPRMHHQWQPDVLQLESGFSPDTVAILSSRGHEIRYTPAMGSLQTVMFRDGLYYGYSDPRRPGAKAVGW